jgi:hemerythrin
MTLVNWQDSYSVKVKRIDDQHKTLFGLVNNVHEAMKQGKSKDVIGGVIDELHKYASTHFAEEETRMRSYNYEGMNEHLTQHKDFIDKVNEFRQMHKEGKLSLSMDVTKFLKDWLVNHIDGTDKKYMPCFHEHGES